MIINKNEEGIRKLFESQIDVYQTLSTHSAYKYAERVWYDLRDFNDRSSICISLITNNAAHLHTMTHNTLQQDFTGYIGEEFTWT